MTKSPDDIRLLLVYTEIMASKTNAWLPRYGRSPNPPSMRLTRRDRDILEAVHAYDGMLSFSQIQRLFFTGKSQTELRLRLLYQNKYLNRPNIEERRKVPEMIYWLDKNGAELIASLQGSPLKEFPWRSSPRWFQVEHDLAVNDFRLDINEASARDDQVKLEEWIPEGEFWSYPDKVSYIYQNKRMQRNIRPDGFFILRAGRHRIRYLLEIDRSTEDNPRFYREVKSPHPLNPYILTLSMSVIAPAFWLNC